ncbi:MAG: dihydroorotase [Myxococcota bacterium]|nr:dihydroorotase [Myxococcota bacterium]
MVEASFTISDARLVCPFQEIDEVGSLVVRDGRIESVSFGPAQPQRAGPHIDGQGLAVAPGFIDLNAFSGEPGREYVGDLTTLACAAARGGFSAVSVSPMTQPVADNVSAATHVRRASRRAKAAILHPIGTVTVGARGERLTDMFDLGDEGVVALTDGPSGVRSSSILRRAMEYAHAAGLPILEAPSDPGLAGSGVMHEGVVATQLGLAGIPSAAEEVRVARGIALSRQSQIPLHIGPISTAVAVDLIEQAKASHVPVTCSVAASHLHFVDEDIAQGWSTDLKLEPPLRTRTDRARLWTGVQHGVIDVIVSGHRPQGLVDKEVPFSKAQPGMVGLETCLGSLMLLVEQGRLSLSTVIRGLTYGPARLLGLGTQGLAEGARADLTIFHPTKKCRVEEQSLLSRSNNSPFLGAVLPGEALLTMAQGRTIFIHSEFQEKAWR